jgi:4-amino-4-deoxy-L-arabinose transferase-like glycosyltransferase
MGRWKQAWNSRPSRWGWALLLLAILVAGGLRFWQLGQLPPGLYRDEAINGLDALDVINGQRDGKSPFYFEANNGREPAYIYLTALSIYFFGRTALSVRLAAAVIGTLTTWFTYKLAKTWFGQGIGLLSAWIWAITIWPIHLSRIGLRPILLPLLLALAYWLGTLAYRRSRDGQPAHWMWLFSGVAFGISFYSYLAARFSVIAIVLLLIYLALTGRGKPLWPGLGWALSGLAVISIPLITLFWQEPDLLIGRVGQVSIFNPAINQGDLIGSFWRQTWQALGLFFVRGDSIVRHNPPGRPVFDWLMLVPFLIGVVWCFRNWRRAAAATLLLWVGVMLGPTILAEDSPHFLRAVGILPGLMMLPAIGLKQIWDWSRLPYRLGQALVVALLAFSLFLSLRDYFFDYGRQPITAYWFESAARELAESVNEGSGDSTIWLDRRFWESWPSVRFLLQNEKLVSFYRPEELEPDLIEQPAIIYAWPFEQLDQVASAIAPPARVSGGTGSLAQGDLEPAPYPLYVKYNVEGMENTPILANFDNNIQLRGAEVTHLSPKKIQVDLYWSQDALTQESAIVFVHVVNPGEGNGELIGQSDSIPSEGNWPSQWWQPGLIIHDRHIIELEEEFDQSRQQIRVGLYEASTLEPLHLLNGEDLPIGDFWLLPLE